MSNDKMPGASLRWDRAEAVRLTWAFIIALSLHAAAFGTYDMGRRLGWWQMLHFPNWMKPRMLTEILKKKEPMGQSERQEMIPLVFVEVNPEQATVEPPKEAKFYSSRNSQAANRESEKETNVPKIDGKRPEFVKTEDVPRQKFTPLQPAPPKPEPEVKKPEQEAKPEPTLKPGDLTLGKPDPNPKKDEGESKQQRPKTVEEAKARLREKQQLPGEKMRQEGGVGRHLKLDSLDAKATEFGDYDYELIRQISNCWHGLLDGQGYASDYRGKVVLRFVLHSNGTITGLAIVENTAGTIPGINCETAVDKPKPYRPFPANMRRVVGETRHIQFTFYYD